MTEVSLAPERPAPVWVKSDEPIVVDTRRDVFRRYGWIGAALGIFAASRLTVIMALFALRPSRPPLGTVTALSSLDGEWYVELARPMRASPS